MKALKSNTLERSLYNSFICSRTFAIELLYKNYESVSEKSNLKTGMENLAHNAEDDSEDKGEARDWNN